MLGLQTLLNPPDQVYRATGGVDSSHFWLRSRDVGIGDGYLHLKSGVGPGSRYRPEAGRGVSHEGWVRRLSNFGSFLLETVTLTYRKEDSRPCTVS